MQISYRTVSYHIVWQPTYSQEVNFKDDKMQTH